MTTEVSIMNKHAVALAADSAVTISVSSDVAPKIFHSVDKLFMLSQSRPVGIMIYGSASFMRMPWETLIKEYRKKLGDRDEACLEDYAIGFIDYLRGHNKRSGSELNFVEQWHIIRFLNWFKARFQQQVEEALKQAGSASESDKQRAKLLRGRLAACLADISKFLQSLDQLEYVSGHKAEELLATNKDWLEGVWSEIFDDTAFTSVQKKKLLGLMGDAVSRDYFFSENDSGIVIAGFGETELYPVMVRCNFEGFLFDRLKYSRYQVVRIDDKRRSFITPFAQSDAIYTFIQGIDPGLMRRIEQSLKHYGDSFQQQLRSTLEQQNIPIEQTEHIVAAMDQFAAGQGESLSTNLGHYAQKTYIDPVVEAVAFLPKHELSHLAESLITLASLRKKMSTESETVGGPVDVAVISKGDGFVWIKRKQYFDRSSN
ncbi:MAG: hypothetical protein V7739_05645 [Motiliproteus sp.]